MDQKCKIEWKSIFNWTKVTLKKLTQEYEECIENCPVVNEGDKEECERICSKVYDKYPLLLYDKYKDNPEKLDEEIKNSQIFTTKDTNSGSWRKFFSFY